MEKKIYQAPEMQVIACEMEQLLLTGSQVGSGSNQARPSTFSLDEAPAATSSYSGPFGSDD